MDKFEHEQYRDNLAKDLREIRDKNPEDAKVVLESIKHTSNYKEAKEIHDKDRIDLYFGGTLNSRDREEGTELLKEKIKEKIDKIACFSDDISTLTGGAHIQPIIPLTPYTKKLIFSKENLDKLIQSFSEENLEKYGGSVSSLDNIIHGLNSLGYFAESAGEKLDISEIKHSVHKYFSDANVIANFNSEHGSFVGISGIEASINKIFKDFEIPNDILSKYHFPKFPGFRTG